MKSMLRLVVEIVGAVLLSVAVTLAVVKMMQVRGLEKELKAAQKKLQGANEKIVELESESEKLRSAQHGQGGHGGQPHWGYEGDNILRYTFYIPGLDEYKRMTDCLYDKGQLKEVFNDTIMDNCQRICRIDMGMSITLNNPSMSCPAGVGNRDRF